MVTQEVIQLQLNGTDQCLCVFLKDVRETKRSQTMALIQGSGAYGSEHAIFMFEGHSKPSLVDIIPIGQDFNFNLGYLPIKIQTNEQVFFVDLEQGESFGLVLNALKQAIQVQAGDTRAGKQHIFTWLPTYFGSVRELESSNFYLDEENQDREPHNHTDTSSWDNLSVGHLDKDSAYKRSFDRHLDALSSGAMAREDGGGKPSSGGRESVVRAVMKDREQEFVEIKTLKIFCGTYNVNEKEPSESLHDWLASDEQPPDIYAIGFQELDMSKNAFIFSDSKKEHEWLSKIIPALHPEVQYRKIRLIRLVGMMIVVFIQKRHVEYVRDVCAETVGTGLLGMMGNKGGVAVRFYLHDTSLCFVNCHLAAHTHEVERRNQDYRDINSKMNFGDRNPPIAIADNDVVFWMGDLNYRINETTWNGPPDEKINVKELSKKAEFSTLLQHDQLHQQMAAKKVLLDFMEGPINFQPTYKYNTGTDDWDSSEKCRTPSYTDRVLWRGPHIQQLRYRSHPTLKISDHKPVSALFNTGVKVINFDLYRKVHEEVMKQLDRMENDFLPQVTLNIVELKFVGVKFMSRVSQIITLTNTGQVPVEFEFIKKHDQPSYAKPWLSVKPIRHVVNVGGKCDIAVEVYVDKITAPPLNLGDDQLEDILVLHLHGGKDLFVTVGGSYVPSCFGTSLETLSRVHGPIRDFEPHMLRALEDGKSEESALIIPKEIWRMVDHLYRFGLQQGDLFQQKGLNVEIQEIGESLDNGAPEVLPGSVHSVAEALLLFLESIAEPVIPFRFYDKCLECCSNLTLCKQVITQLPPSHLHVFEYLCLFLKKILQFSDNNHLDANLLARLFGRVLLRPPKGRVQPRSDRRAQQREEVEERQKSAFLYGFITDTSS